MVEEIVVMCGLPGSGKTTYVYNTYDQLVPGNLVLDGDSLKTSDKIVKELKSAMKNDFNRIIIDSTAYSLERRADIIKAARGIPVKCIYVKLDRKTCIERIKQRVANGGRNVSSIAVNTINKRFVEPSLEEGFASIEYIEPFDIEANN